MTAQSPFTFDILGNFALAEVIFGAYQAGLWEPFQRDLEHVLDPDRFAADRGCNPRLVRGLAEYLSRRQLLELVLYEGRAVFQLAPKGRVLIGDDWLGYFVFMVGGYGEVLHASGKLASRQLGYGVDIRRNGHYVALGSELNGRSRNHRSFEVILARASDGPMPRTVLDIGCGSAAFLIMLMERTRAERGIGIDIDEQSCVLSRNNLARAGLGERVQVVHGDARKLLDDQPDLEAGVDMITAMFLIHELLGDGFDVAAARLREISRALTADSGRFLILDKHTDVLEDGGAPPYFTEFKLVHDLTDQVLCSRRQWHQVIAAAGLDIVHEQTLAPHTGSILFECRKRQP